MCVYSHVTYTSTPFSPLLLHKKPIRYKQLYISRRIIVFQLNYFVVNEV